MSKVQKIAFNSQEMHLSSELTAKNVNDRQKRYGRIVLGFKITGLALSALALGGIAKTMAAKDNGFSKEQPLVKDPIVLVSHIRSGNGASTMEILRASEVNEDFSGARKKAISKPNVTLEQMKKAHEGMY